VLEVRVTVKELKLTVGRAVPANPVRGLTTTDARLIEPEKPFKLAIVTVVEPVEPSETVISDCDTMMEKSTTSTVTTMLCEIKPLLPVTVTVEVPAVDALQDSTEVPNPGRLLCDRAHVKPLVEATVSERPTVPVNPFIAVTVIVEVAVALTRAVTDIEVAAILKS